MERPHVSQPSPFTAQPHLSGEVPAFTPILSAFNNFLPGLPPAKFLASGTILIGQGRRVQDVHLIQTGLLKLIHVRPSGREITVGLRSQGWYGGCTSVLLNAPSVYSVRAVTDCTISRIPSTEFLRCLRENAGMFEHFLEALCLEIASQAALQVEMMSGSAEDRLDRFMRERATVHPSRKFLDPLPSLKQMELAQLLSITPEHLSRLMHKKRDASFRQAHAKDRKPVKLAHPKLV